MSKNASVYRNVSEVKIMKTITDAENSDNESLIINEGIGETVTEFNYLAATITNT